MVKSLKDFFLKKALKADFQKVSRLRFEKAFNILYHEAFLTAIFESFQKRSLNLLRLSSFKSFYLVVSG